MFPNPYMKEISKLESQLAERQQRYDQLVLRCKEETNRVMSHAQRINELKRQRDAAVEALREIKRLGWSAKQKTIRRMSDIAHLALVIYEQNE